MQLCENHEKDDIGDIMLMEDENSRVAYARYLYLSLPRIVRMKKWKQKSTALRISEFVTITEEAFGLLVLENSVKKWMMMANGEHINNKLDLLRYQKSKKEGTKNKGKKFQAGAWSDEGLERFNDLFQKIKTIREEEWRKELEETLKDTLQKNADGLEECNDHSESQDDNVCGKRKRVVPISEWE